MACSLTSSLHFFFCPPLHSLLGVKTACPAELLIITVTCYSLRASLPALHTSSSFIPLFCLLSFLFSLSLLPFGSAALDSSLSPSHSSVYPGQLSVFVRACVCVCISGRYGLSTPHRSCSVAHFPFPLLPSHLLLILPSPFFFIISFC